VTIERVSYEERAPGRPELRFTTSCLPTVRASLTEVRRWRRGLHQPERKFAERVRALEEKTYAILISVSYSTPRFATMLRCSDVRIVRARVAMSKSGGDGN